MPLHLTIVTPEKQLLSEEVDELIAPTTSGELSILPEHVALLAELTPGELSIKKGSKIEHFVVVGGFLEVNPEKGGVAKNAVTVLADYAVAGKDISEAQAQQAKDRAEKAMKEKAGDVDFATAEAEFRRAILELKVAKRQKRTI